MPILKTQVCRIYSLKYLFSVVTWCCWIRSLCGVSSCYGCCGNITTTTLKTVCLLVVDIFVRALSWHTRTRVPPLLSHLVQLRNLEKKIMKDDIKRGVCSFTSVSPCYLQPASWKTNLYLQPCTTICTGFTFRCCTGFTYRRFSGCIGSTDI